MSEAEVKRRKREVEDKAAEQEMCLPVLLVDCPHANRPHSVLVSAQLQVARGTDMWMFGGMDDLAALAPSPHTQLLLV